MQVTRDILVAELYLSVLFQHDCLQVICECFLVSTHAEITSSNSDTNIKKSKNVSSS